MVAILHPTGPGSQIPIDRAVVLIGRSPDCDAVLDVSTKISRMHCALVQVDSDYYIRDLGSMNGITVAGHRVEKDVKLNNGVEVMIGDVKFMFLENVVPAPRPPRTGGSKSSPVLIDETVDVVEVSDVEVIETAEPVPSGARSPSLLNRPPQRPLVNSSDDDQTVRLRSSGLDGAEILDVEIVDALEIVEEIEVINDVEVVEDVVEVLDVVDVVDVVEEIENVEVVDVLDEIEVIDEVEVLDEEPRKRRPPPRLR